MGTSSSFDEAAAKLERALDAQTVRAMARAGGEAAVKAAQSSASGDFGGDRRMSGFPAAGTLDASSVVHGDQALVEYAGPWGLAEKGRRQSKVVRAPSVRGAEAYLTPAGPRARFTSKPTRGKGTLTAAQRQAAEEVPKAADEALRDELGKVF